MAYTAFTDNSIFADNKINIYCNALMNYVVVTNGYDASVFVLSGVPAALLQDDPNQEIKLIPFVTDDVQLFELIGTELVSVFQNAQVIRFRDHVKFTIGGYFFEIWLVDSFSSIDAFKVKVNTIATIPQNLYNAQQP